jgi:hypothetical protein
VPSPAKFSSGFNRLALKPRPPRRIRWTKNDLTSGDSTRTQSSRLASRSLGLSGSMTRQIRKIASSRLISNDVGTIGKGLDDNLSLHQGGLGAME